MEGGNNAFYNFNNIVAVIVACVCKLYKRRKEVVGIKIYRVSYVDKIVFGFLKTFLCHQLLLVKLFALTKTGINYLYIDIRLEARKLYEVSCKRVYLDRRAHVQNKYLAAVSVYACL